MLIDKKAFYKFRYIWLIASGAILSLPLVVPSLGFLQWIAMIPCAMLLYVIVDGEKVTKRGAYLLGFAFFMSYYAVTFHWFYYMYPLEVAGVSEGIALIIVSLGCFGLAFLQSLFSSVGFVAFVLLARTNFVRKRAYFMPLLMASIWVIAEWWQTIGWWGVPWGRLPLGQVSFTLLVRSASLFGSYFITFVIVAVNFFLAMVILKQGFRRVAAVCAVSLFALNLVLGLGVTLAYEESDEKYTVAAAQGNISSAYRLPRRP